MQAQLRRTPTTVTKRLQDEDAEGLANFRRYIDSAMQIERRDADTMRLLPDAETAQADRTAAEMTKKRRYNDAQGKAELAAVKRVYQGGKISEQDARVVQASKNSIQQSAAYITQTYGDVKDTTETKALTRAIAETIGVGKVGQYTEQEYDKCIVDAVKGRETYDNLTRKYGPSKATIKRGITHVYELLEKGIQHPDRPTTKQAARKMDEVDIFAILTRLREENIIKKDGAQPLLTKAELKYCVAMFGALGNTGLGQNDATAVAAVREAINNMGKAMLAAISRAEQRGDYVDPREKSKAERFANASITPDTWRNWKRKYNEDGGVGPGTLVCEKGRKASGLSQARANTNTKYLTAGMFRQIDNTIQEMRDDGRLGPVINQP